MLDLVVEPLERCKCICFAGVGSACYPGPGTPGGRMRHLRIAESPAPIQHSMPQYHQPAIFVSK